MRSLRGGARARASSSKDCVKGLTNVRLEVYENKIEYRSVEKNNVVGTDLCSSFTDHKFRRAKKNDRQKHQPRHFLHFYVLFVLRDSHLCTKPICTYVFKYANEFFLHLHTSEQSLNDKIFVFEYKNKRIFGKTVHVRATTSDRSCLFILRRNTGNIANCDGSFNCRWNTGVV